MRRFALGALFYDPQRFGFMMVGDFIDALGGYNEAELERIKAVAEIVRKSTTLLWNIQVIEESRLEPDKLWPLPWDKAETIKEEPVPEEVKKEIDNKHENILSNM
jgi:hypothetical protein